MSPNIYLKSPAGWVCLWALFCPTDGNVCFGAYTILISFCCPITK